MPEFRAPLFESCVICAVRGYLEQSGYQVEQALSESEQGDDIVASSPRDGIRLYIEAKGATSSKPGSKRYGRPFSPAQVRDHVANAFYRAAHMLTRTSDFSTRVGMALPDNADHQRRVAEIGGALRNLGVEVFWVSSERVVTRQGYWGSDVHF